MTSHRCYRYPCDTAHTRGSHSSEPQLHRVHVGESLYLAPTQHGWSVGVVADGGDGPWRVRLKVGKTHVDLGTSQQVEELVEHVIRAAMWQARYVQEDTLRDLAATEADLEAALDPENIEAATT